MGKIGGTRCQIYIRMLHGQDYSDLAGQVSRVAYDRMIRTIKKWRPVESRDALLSVKARECGLSLRTCRVLARTYREYERNSI